MRRDRIRQGTTSAATGGPGPSRCTCGGPGWRPRVLHLCCTCGGPGWRPRVPQMGPPQVQQLTGRGPSRCTCGAPGGRAAREAPEAALAEAPGGRLAGGRPGGRPPWREAPEAEAAPARPRGLVNYSPTPTPGKAVQSSSSVASGCASAAGEGFGCPCPETFTRSPSAQTQRCIWAEAHRKHAIQRTLRLGCG